MTDSERDAGSNTEPPARQAIAWWLDLRDGRSPSGDRRAFSQWLGKSPQHVGEYLQTMVFMNALRRQMKSLPRVPPEDIVDQAKRANATVVPLPLGSMTQQVSLRTMPVRRKWALAGIAAALAVIVVGGILIPNRDSVTRYETALGEQRSVVLDDGSVVTLNTATAIEVRLGKSLRSIRLKKGEALFVVAHDTRRPFEVGTSNARVRAVGTQFNVDQRDHRTVVTVVEGKVRVAADGADAQLISASERIVVEDASLGKTEPVRDVGKATAWTQRRLIFDGRPLGEVAAEFNRYNRVQLEIVDESLRAQQVSGTFQSNELESFLPFLSDIPGVRIERTEDTVRVVSGTQSTSR